MARPENRWEPVKIAVKLPKETANYLRLLADLGRLGRTTEEVAAHILVREVYALHAKGFQEPRFPSEVRELNLSGFVLAGQKSAEGVLIQSVSKRPDNGSKLQGCTLPMTY